MATSRVQADARRGEELREYRTLIFDSILYTLDYHPHTTCMNEVALGLKSDALHICHFSVLHRFHGFKQLHATWPQVFEYLRLCYACKNWFNDRYIGERVTDTGYNMNATTFTVHFDKLPVLM